MSCSNCKAPTLLVWSCVRICLKIFVDSIVNLLETLVNQFFFFVSGQLVVFV